MMHKLRNFVIGVDVFSVGRIYESPCELSYG